MRLSALGTAAIVALTLVGCGGTAEPEPATGSSSTASSPVETDADATASAAACGNRTAPHPELARQLPAGFPTVAGWTATEVVNQGQTRVVNGILPGEAADLVRVRDSAASQITATGYTKSGSDEEPGFEAEAEFEGPHEVNIKVKPLCRGYLVLSYTVRQ
ncbi:hypothetical protein [Jatrophihabitans sp.]|jgi:hypothetical protein|uniref:hypothetical protein n=1 Tax=Jatrophihabitans sp. TaxID=1932789 RepID=UPI002F0956A7